MQIALRHRDQIRERPVVIQDPEHRSIRTMRVQSLAAGLAIPEAVALSTRRRWNASGVALLIVPALVFVAMFYVYPLVNLLDGSLRDPNATSFARRIFTKCESSAVSMSTSFLRARGKATL